MMVFIIIGVFIILYILSVLFSMWQMDMDNPRSYWYCDKDDDGILQFIFCGLPFVNIIFSGIVSTRYESNK